MELVNIRDIFRNTQEYANKEVTAIQRILDLSLSTMELSLSRYRLSMQTDLQIMRKYAKSMSAQPSL